MKITELIARILLGLSMTIFGLNKFLNFIPMGEMPEAEANLMGAFAASGFMFPAIALVEIIGGVLLLTNRMIGLALVILAPIIVNILLVHLFLAPAGLAIALVQVALIGILFYAHKEKFYPMISLKG
ncbi:DoxX family membrane protein [Persicobacter diffluens]|uniref:DoxX family protein n=1 Tax=Persicobacter diffluens TaxID=981 RepID=A0AAN4W1Y7_9BACT|nr:hypothetical protein PEDI_33740 [Persicobacter diffluens]